MGIKSANTGTYLKWRPLTLDFLVSNYSLTDKNLLAYLAGWIILVSLSLYLSAGLSIQNYLQITGDKIAIIDLLIFNPTLILGILLFYWFGFEWGFLPVYLSAFVVANLSGIPVLWATLIGLSFVLGMGLYALAYQSIRIDYNLRNLKSLSFFIVVTFLASFASSMGSFIWGFFHHLSVQETLIIWKSWWTGIFFQTLIIAGSLIYLLTPTVERWKQKYFTLPPEKKVSVHWIYGSVITVALTLSIFVFSGYTLGRLNIQEIVSNYQIVPASELLGSIEAFEIIVWISISIIVVTASTAIYLLNNWNVALQNEVDNRTSDLVISQKKLKKSLSEKEILFKELEHRVKNNLAQVYSMLELQELMSDNSELASLLKISKNRIHTMTLAHDALYNTSDFSKIQLKDYVENIAVATHESFVDTQKKIQLKYDINDIQIDMGKAIPFGLMVSEILINAHKHAFDGRKEGSIKITTRIFDDNILLSISDNGNGISKKQKDPEKESLGMMLIK
ncbi:MAG: histidine kinase dimerization/phosphoacceptor domain -containing protein, partial [Balneolaceae bacterium]